LKLRESGYREVKIPFQYDEYPTNSELKKVAKQLGLLLLKRSQNVKDYNNKSLNFFKGYSSPRIGFRLINVD
jgi:hypothetical protein